MNFNRLWRITLPISSLLSLFAIGIFLFDQQQNDTNASTAVSPQNPLTNQLNAVSPLPSTTSSINNNHKHVDDKTLARLMKKHVTPEMRKQINQRLEPEGKPPKTIINNNIGYIDLSDRASTVMVAIIDDNGDVVVTDITHKLPE